jgi:hypothetical protein
MRKIKIQLESLKYKIPIVLSALNFRIKVWWYKKRKK